MRLLRVCPPSPRHFAWPSLFTLTLAAACFDPEGAVDDDGALSGLCGNGELDEGELCDEGVNNSDHGVCKTDCTPQSCGDGMLGPGELCDPGDPETGPGCSASCVPQSCGDGTRDPGEECDDGNQQNDDDCVAGCKQASCGDGFVHAETELCDDGSGTRPEDCASLEACEPPEQPEGLALGFAPIKRLEFTWTPALGAASYHLYEAPGLSHSDELVPVGQPTSATTLTLSGVPLAWSFGARYVLRACNQTGCTDSPPLTVAESMVEAVGYFKASNPGPVDNFGAVVALSGDGHTLAVGAHQEDGSATGVSVDPGNDNGSSAAGAVYVFRRDPQTLEWAPEPTYIKASNTDSNDHFGVAVALNGDGHTLVVGASDEDSAASGINGNQVDDTLGSSGAVYVYRRDPQSLEWEPEPTYIKASNPDSSDNFGDSVALSGDGHTLAVGAANEDGSATGIDGVVDDLMSAAGAVYVYRRDPQTLEWQPGPTYIKASNTDSSDLFGISVALSADGHTLAVGAYQEDSGGLEADNSVGAAGAVYVYRRDPQTLEWSPEIDYIKAQNPDSNDYFGFALDLSGDGHTLAVGAYQEDGSAVGVGKDPDNGSSAAGAVYVYTRDPETLAWDPTPVYVKAANTGSSDQFGYALALSGDGLALAVGAITEDSPVEGVGGYLADNGASSAGAVYAYRRDPETGEWLDAPVYVKAVAPDGSDYFGQSVALSDDGRSLAVGAYREDGGSASLDNVPTDDSVEDAGAVYLY